MAIKRSSDPESITMTDLDPEANIVADNRTMDPEPSTVTDSRTLDLESSSDPLHHTAYRTQADALFRKNLTYQVSYIQPIYGVCDVNNPISKCKMQDEND